MKKEFQVVTISTSNQLKWSHWADNLTMIIVKDGVRIELNSEEIRELVKSLPKTVGGTY